MVVLSDAIWKRRFGARTDIAGSKVRLNGELYTIIGVMRPDFISEPQRTAVDAALVLPKGRDGTRQNHFIDAIARLKPNVHIAHARTDVQGIARQLRRVFTENTNLGADISQLHDFGDRGRSFCLVHSARSRGHRAADFA